jgi:hypothetical protein
MSEAPKSELKGSQLLGNMTGGGPQGRARAPASACRQRQEASTLAKGLLVRAYDRTCQVRGSSSRTSLAVTSQVSPEQRRKASRVASTARCAASWRPACNAITRKSLGRRLFVLGGRMRVAHHG